MSSPGCTGKVRHASRSDAQRAISRGRIRHRGDRRHHRVDVYPCAECGAFHVGSRPRRHR